jgi:CubicO group peptidase (beta-lactamase class C family)
MKTQSLTKPLMRTFAACMLMLPIPALAQTTQVEAKLETVLADAESLAPLETVLVSVAGEVVAQRGYRGNSVSDPTNIKSASKSIISALVGIAIDRGLLEGVDQPVAELLADQLPDDPDPAINEITVGNLLSMQAGLERTSGPNYGAWVASPNWVRFVLAQSFEDEPGGAMLYSTGSTHLLSAILTRVGGQSTLELARDWLSPLEDFSIASWDRDPQGIYFGGNQMAMSPRSLLSFGELYRNGGLTASGEQVISEDWIAQSWEQRTNSRFTGDEYGYGWFGRENAEEQVHYGWGYGGQMLYIVPSLELTVVMTSNENSPSARNGHRDDLHELLGEIIDAVR